MSKSEVCVVTINILSDLSLWKQRRPLLVAGLSSLRPDLIAVQEAHMRARTAEWLADRLEMPHVYVSPKNSAMGEVEGIAFLSRLPLLETETLDLKTQSRVAQIIRGQAGEREVLFANGHFYWQPGDTQARLDQVRLLQERLDAISANLPKVVCGDFNGKPGSLSILHMKRKYISAYQAVHSSEPEFTAPTPLPRSWSSMLRTLFRYSKNIRSGEITFRWKGTLDYIFVSPGVEVLDSKLVLNEPAPTQPRLYPSDHFGVMARLRF